MGWMHLYCYWFIPEVIVIYFNTPSIHTPVMRLYAVISNGCNLACETLITANNYTLAGLKCGKLSSA